MEKTVMQKRRAMIDLIVICAITMIVLGIFIAIQDIVESFARDTAKHILLRTAAMALLQFGTAGLGISLVMIIRKESFFDYGLRRENSDQERNR